MSDSKGWGAALVLAWFLWLSMPNEGDNKLTAYEEYCSDFESDFDKCNAGYHVRPREFKISFERQMVIEKNAIYPLKSCMVYDRENWKCKQDDREIRMSNGDLVQEPFTIVDDNGKSSYLYLYTSTSWLGYWINQIRNLKF